MATIISYGSKAINPLGAAALTIPPGQNIGILDTSVVIPPENPASFSNRVELKASINIDQIVTPDNFNVVILRAGTVIYRSHIRLVGTANPEIKQINVLWVDGAPLGVINYQLGIENSNPGTTFITIVGPVVFTATAIGGEGVI
jgi:hypothetical protein